MELRQHIKKNNIEDEISFLLNKSILFYLYENFEKGSRKSLKRIVGEFERQIITTALDISKWNQKRTAKVLNVKPTTLNTKIKKYNIGIHELNDSPRFQISELLEKINSL